MTAMHVAFVLSAWTSFALAFTLLTMAACARLARRIRRHHAPARWPDVWLFRPCQGDEHGLYENLASSLVAYPGARRVLIMVPTEDDASAPAARRVVELAPDRVHLLFTGVRDAPNRKSAQLAHGLAYACATPEPPELIVQADSDIRLEENALVDLVEAIETEQAGAAFMTPVDLDVQTFGDLGASGLLTTSHQNFYALAALSAITDGVCSIAGPLAIYRRSSLEAIGGFAALTELLGEDFEVGRRLHERQLGVAVSRGRATSPETGRAYATVLARTSRWAMVVRRQRPGLVYTYPLLLACTPILLLASGALAAAGGPLWPLGGAMVLVAARLAFAKQLRRTVAAPVSVWQALKLVLASELLMLHSAALALGRSRVVWRGRLLEIGPGGTIQVIADLTAPPTTHKVAAP